MRPHLTLMVPLSVCALALSASASSVVFSDNFSEDPVGSAKTKLTNWITTRGTIDVLRAGDLAPASFGRHLDLDGSTKTAATLQSIGLALPAGSYQLSFDLAGSQRKLSPSDSVTVSLGNIAGAPGATSPLALSKSFSLPYSSPFVTESIPFTLASAASNAQLVFNAAGGDNMGLLLDNVQIVNLGAPGTSPAPTTPPAAGPVPAPGPVPTPPAAGPIPVPLPPAFYSALPLLSGLIFLRKFRARSA